MATWTPQPQGLQEILQTVHDSMNQDRKVQQAITMVCRQRSTCARAQRTRQRLNQFQKVPDYTAYLAHILSRMPGEQERIRTIAGYILKNNAKLLLRAPPDVAHFVKQSILMAFTDSSVMIRTAASNNIISYLEVIEPQNWPECLQMLIQALDSPDAELQEVRGLGENCAPSSSVTRRRSCMSSRKRARTIRANLMSIWVALVR